MSRLSWEIANQKATILDLSADIAARDLLIQGLEAERDSLRDDLRDKGMEADHYRVLFEQMISPWFWLGDQSPDWTLRPMPYAENTKDELQFVFTVGRRYAVGASPLEAVEHAMQMSATESEAKP